MCLTCPLLALLTESSFLKTLKVREVIISFGKKAERDRGSIVGKFTQSSMADISRLTRSLVTDPADLECFVRDIHGSTWLARLKTAFFRGRIIHCAGCTMGRGRAASWGPRSTANFLPRCVDVR